MTRLTNLTAAEKKFLDEAVAAAERVSGKKLNQQNRHIVRNWARAQIERSDMLTVSGRWHDEERSRRILHGHVRAPRR